MGVATVRNRLCAPEARGSGSGLEAIPGLATPAQPQEASGSAENGCVRPPRVKAEKKPLGPKEMASKAIKDGNKHQQEIKTLRLKLQSSESLYLGIHLSPFFCF